MKSDKYQARILGSEDWDETTWNCDTTENEPDTWTMRYAAEEYAKEYYEKYSDGPANEFDHIIEVKDYFDNIKTFQVKGHYEPEFDAEEIL